MKQAHNSEKKLTFLQNITGNKAIIYHKLKSFLPFIILFVYFLILHKNIPFENDDVVRKEKELSLFFILNRYNTWSTRLIADTVAIIFSKIPFTIFKILDSMVYMFIAWCFSIFFNPQKNRKLDCFICLLVSIFPFITMGTAGWVSTSTGYTWPLLCCLFAFIPIIKIKQNQKISKLHLIYAIPCLLYGTDPQALCIPVLIITFLLLILYIIKNKNIKKVNWYIIFLFLISLCKLVFILVSPSILYRTKLETESFFRAFANLNIIQKIYMGYIYTFRVIILYPWLFIILLIIINYLTHINYKNNIINKLLSDMLLIIMLFFTICREFITNNITPLFENFYRYIFTDFTTGDIDFYVLLFLLITFIFLSTIYLLFINTYKEKYIVNIIFLLGLMSQMIMAFSPTIYASSTRTACFMFFSIIIVNIYLLNYLIKTNKNMEIFYLLLLILSFIQLIEFW